MQYERKGLNHSAKPEQYIYIFNLCKIYVKIIFDFFSIIAYDELKDKIFKE